MRIQWAMRFLVLLLASGAFTGAVAQAESRGDRTRAGFDGLSREMSTCAAYFSLLASIVENSKGPSQNDEIAQHIKSRGEAMLTHAINVARYVGRGDDIVMERVQAALKDMVNTANHDPPNSLKVMHAKYGQPCDELLQSGPRRFIDLLEGHGQDF